MNQKNKCGNNALLLASSFSEPIARLVLEDEEFSGANEANRGFERGEHRIQTLRAKWGSNCMVLWPQILSKILCWCLSTQFYM